MMSREKHRGAKLPVFVICVFVVFSCPLLGGAMEGCKPTRCGKGGPKIQFPFRHKDIQSQDCGYPGFELYCNNSETMLKLPDSVEVPVKAIDYVSQTLQFSSLGRCLPQKLPDLNLSASPFHFPVGDLSNYTLFNCSDADRDLQVVVPCLSGPGYRVYAVASDPMSHLYNNPYSFPSSLSSCTKIQEILSVPQSILVNTESLQLEWSKPECGTCEARGKLCRLKIETTGNRTQCADKSKTNQGASKGPVIAGVAVGSVLLVAAVGAFYYYYCSLRGYKVNRVKIEKFLEDYKALKPARFSYGDIRRITNNFNEKLGEGGFGSVYKGKLSCEVYVAVKVLNYANGNGEEFLNEVAIIGRIHHVNVARLIGFCAEGYTRALVYEFLQNSSLDKFIFAEGSERRHLSMEKLQEIAIGIGKGIEYLHQGCDMQILHFDIKPHNILLDQNLNPKISDFGLAKLCSKEQSSVSVTTGRGTIGYIAPEVLSRAFGRVSYKSDIYSFGMVLLEMVGGRMNEESDMHLGKDIPQWIYNRLNEKEHVTEGEKDKIKRKLAVAGLWCIQWHPADRPSMKAVVQLLEGDGDNLAMPPNPFPDMNAAARHHQPEMVVILESE